MKTVWKYVMDNIVPSIFEIPEGSNILRVAMQGKYICLWFCVLPNAPKEKRTFIFTGNWAVGRSES